MSEQRRNEKEEEKRTEKHDEKGRSMEEKWQHDRLRAISIAVILIWGGLVALAGARCPTNSLNRLASVASWL